MSRKAEDLLHRKAEDLLHGKAVITALGGRVLIAALESRKLLLPYQILRFCILTGNCKLIILGKIY